MAQAVPAGSEAVEVERYGCLRKDRQIVGALGYHTLSAGGRPAISHCNCGAIVTSSMSTASSYNPVLPGRMSRTG